MPIRMYGALLACLLGAAMAVASVAALVAQLSLAMWFMCMLAGWIGGVVGVALWHVTGAILVETQSRREMREMDAERRARLLEFARWMASNQTDMRPDETKDG